MSRKLLFHMIILVSTQVTDGNNGTHDLNLVVTMMTRPVFLLATEKLLKGKFHKTRGSVKSKLAMF